MEINKQMKIELATLIIEEIKEEFSNIKLSGNLLNSIRFFQTEDNVKIEIYPKFYDILLYKQKGIIRNTGKPGSYASHVDKTGGFSGKHKNYVDDCIDRAIKKWLFAYNINGRIG